MPLESQALFVGYLVHLFALGLGLLLLAWLAVLILLWAIDRSTFRTRMLLRIAEYARHRDEFLKWKAEKDSAKGGVVFEIKQCEKDAAKDV